MPRIPFLSSLLAAALLAATSVPAQQPAAPAPPPPAEEVAPKPKADYGYPAAWTPFQLGVLERYQLFSRDTPVHGLRLGLLTANNNDVRGASLSLVSNYAVEQRGVEAAFVNTATASRGIVLGGVNVTLRPREEHGPSGFGGIGLAALVNAHKRDVAGIQAAGLANHISGNATGLAMAGVYNAARDGAGGLQLAGIANDVRGDFEGGQLAGIYNATVGEARGMQLAGVSNLAEGSAAGIQVAGILNVIQSPDEAPVVEGEAPPPVAPPEPSGRILGLRLAGVCNLSEVSTRNDVIAASLACNLTRGDHRGAQLAAFNKARRTSGLQVGLLNDSEELRGVQIGLFNFRDGRMRWPLVNIGRD